MIDAMIALNRHRGADDEGRDVRAGIHFGHTRLAVIDPANGAQPMTRPAAPNGTGRYTVVYNGEIYNYGDLRRELESRGHVFTTSCDTEVIPIGFAEWGSGLFDRLDGMFAFALRDNETGDLWLARDHLGIKPLYYALGDGRLAFSSTARALADFPGVSRRLNPDAVREFLQFRWIRSGRSPHADIRVLPPGTVLLWSRGKAELRPYWRPGSAASDGPKTHDQWIEAAAALLKDTVRRQLRSDVPLGILLSGGVDSALVAHFAAAAGAGNITAFTFSSGGPDDETAAARETAEACGFAHRAVELEDADFARFPDVIGAMDQPVGDAVVLPTWKLCAESARHVTVVLTGEGADELFAGYAHLPVLRRLDRLAPLSPLMRLAAPLLDLVPTSIVDRLFQSHGPLGRLGRRAAADLLAAAGNSGLSLARAEAVLNDREIVRATTLGPMPAPPPADLSLHGLLRNLLAFWLPEEILHKMDQLSMASGLEARVPYASKALVELMLSCPEPYLLKGAVGKRLLRDIAARENLAAARRPKVPFQLATDQRWRSRISLLFQTWLSGDIIARHRIVRPEYVRETLVAFDRGEFLAGKRLMAMASLHMWLEKRGGSL